MEDPKSLSGASRAQLGLRFLVVGQSVFRVKDEGCDEGCPVGKLVGCPDGCIEGWLEGCPVGRADGWLLGCAVGTLEGCAVGNAEGCDDG